MAKTTRCELVERYLLLLLMTLIYGKETRIKGCDMKMQGFCPDSSALSVVVVILVSTVTVQFAARGMLSILLLTPAIEMNKVALNVIPHQLIVRNVPLKSDKILL